MKNLKYHKCNHQSADVREQLPKLELVSVLHFANSFLLFLGQFRYKRGIFRFGHSESLVPLLSILGLYKDTEDLRADNFANKKDRKFRASLISPFAANLAFILHKCDSHEDRGDSLESFQLQLLVNEKPTKFPFCDTDLCPYSVVRQQYSYYINDCDLASMCRLQESNKDEL